MKALDGAKEKSDSIPPAEESPLSPETKTRLDAKQPLFESLLQARGTALSGQAGASSTEDTAQEATHNVISHFIQVFNFGIVRNKYPEADRAHYQLDVGTGFVPSLTQESDIVLWGQRLIDGEAARVSAGGPAMENPSITEVETAYETFMTEHTAQSGKKDEFDESQETVEDERDDTDDIIVDVWDEVEFFFRKDEASSKRRKAREWGVVYINDEGEEEEPEPPPPIEP